MRDDMHHPSGGNDIPSLSAWIKKFDLSKQVEFFGDPVDVKDELFTSSKLTVLD